MKHSSHMQYKCMQGISFVAYFKKNKKKRCVSCVKEYVMYCSHDACQIMCMYGTTFVKKVRTSYDKRVLHILQSLQVPYQGYEQNTWTMQRWCTKHESPCEWVISPHKKRILMCIKRILMCIIKELWSCHTRDRAMWRHLKASCHIYIWAMARICMSHVTLVNYESCLQRVYSFK